MHKRQSLAWRLTIVTVVLLTRPLLAIAAESKVLIDVSAEGAEARLLPSWGSGEQVTVSRSHDAAAPGLILSVKPGEAGYPGVSLKPEGAASWDLSAFGHVEARVVNIGAKGASFALRVDNNAPDASEPWNAEQTYLAPGQSGTVSVIFGHSYGHKPAYPLKPDAVVGIVMFTSKSDDLQTLRIESLLAAGPKGEKPPVDPNSVRTKPKDGILVGAGAQIEPATQLTTGGARVAAAANGALQLGFVASQPGQAVTLKPSIGRWDLRDASRVRVRIRNQGVAPFSPQIQLSSDSGTTDAITAAAIAPGAEAEVVVPFAPATAWKGIPNSGDRTSWEGQPNTGTKFASDAVASIRIAAGNDAAAELLVESIIADAGVADLPDWLGQRPPVAGEWLKTFEDNFDGTAIDAKRWDVAGPNYWDKTTHWSKDNVIVRDGLARMRYEKRTGYHNDDPEEKQSSYASGFLQTYGKWVQRYGYFETRVKLPRAPGLWPAFWVMPDRGQAAGPQWKRQATDNGAMEFDVMEHLTRWGPNRYCIAMHWDGYEKDHKQTGSGNIYSQPDKDGFITSGLLWLPGVAAYYCNGKEVARWEDPRISSVPSDLMFTLPAGGWDNNALDDTLLPGELVIDYVRVWQRKDLASPVDGVQSPAGPVQQDAAAAQGAVAPQGAGAAQGAAIAK